ncbi:helix-turn-helix transcriptional regulator [Mycolicibacterium sp. lyk4-40-TYG-92]|uniref:helix-turn-helix transcriptional regulator n=1 Tax=Mycolicibacterium sp. lyk4-40-TYG-92 TaxID=3040295 RepID=UPI00254B9E24|nr:helix-turn-helix transcriptional regulator [Mycolicibacterium sp. lyk4-40-TYG-92]
MASKNRRQYSVDAATFAERLNRLFATIRPPGRGPYRSFEVTEALTRRGYQLSAPYLSQLRSGNRKYPSPRTAEMFAEFFGVEVEYFDPETSYARALDAELDWLELAHDKTVRELTTALMTLTPSQRDELLDQVDRCQFDCMATITEPFTGRPIRPAEPAGCARA